MMMKVRWQVLVGIHYDITELKQLQLDLEESREIAENAREAQKNFLANMSHEIRNPIHSIGGMSELLASTSLNSTQEQYLRNIQSASDILRALVSDILDISKIDEGKMEMRPSTFDLHNVLSNITDYAYTLVRDKEVHFIQNADTTIPTWLSGDTTFLNQVLMNLISNAVKFTNAGNIELKSRLVSTTPEQAVIEFTLQDTGIGIPEDKLDKIFDRFGQAGYASKVERTGSGLGLTIVKNLVRIMGGRIRVESQVNEGSKFTVTIPFRIVSNESISLSNVNSLEGSLNILIVEDSEINRAFLEHTLTGLGHKWISCTNGKQGLEATLLSTFDLILADIRMPEMDGYEMTENLRRSAKNLNRYTPVIALTASALLDEKERALAAGMNYHLSKPFTKEQLQKAIFFFYQIEVEGSAENFSLTLNKGIDQTILDELYDGDWEHILLMMQVFMQNADNVITDIEEVFSAQDREGLAAQLHKLKPGLMMIGLRQCHDYLVEIEEMTQSMGMSDQELHTLFDAFVVEFKSALPCVSYAVRQIKEFLQ